MEKYEEEPPLPLWKKVAIIVLAFLCAFIFSTLTCASLTMKEGL